MFGKLPFFFKPVFACASYCQVVHDFRPCWFRISSSFQMGFTCLNLRNSWLIRNRRSLRF